MRTHFCGIVLGLVLFASPCGPFALSYDEGKDDKVTPAAEPLAKKPSPDVQTPGVDPGDVPKNEPSLPKPASKKIIEGGKPKPSGGGPEKRRRNSPNRTPTSSAAATASTFAYPKRTEEPANRVYTLLFSNNDDGRGSESIVPGIRANRRFLDELLDVECVGRREDVVPRASDDFDPERVFQVIRSLRSRVTKDDVVFCHISTHGGFDDQFLRGPHPDHTLEASGGDGNRVARRVDIMSELRKLNPRLIVFATDSCGTRFSSPAPIRPLTEAAAASANHALHELLFYSSGTISINAAEPGKAAIYYLSDKENGGGFFTRAFCHKSLFAEKKDWRSFVEAVSDLSTAQRPSSGEPQPKPCLFDGDEFPVDLSGRPLDF